MSGPTDDWYAADEEFWASTYPFMFPESRFAAAGHEVERVLALVQRTGGTVLDLGCGPGRHSAPLGQRGFAVTGVDHSAFLLDRARARAAELGTEVEWVRADMRTFRRPAAFDLALSLYTSFGYFRDDADNQRVLDNVAASLRAGGTLVLDVVGKEVLARTFTATTSQEYRDGLVVHRRRVTHGWSQLHLQWTMLQGGAARTVRYSHWIYSGREIERMFGQAGLSEVRLYGDLRGAPYGPGAERLIVIGQKGSD